MSINSCNFTSHELSVTKAKSPFMDFNPYVTMKSYTEVILLQYKKCPQDGSQMGIKSIDGKKC